MTEETTSVRRRRREAVLDPLADHVLRHGLDGANLRSLARAAGTSDRMLLYYFEDKADLLRAVLEHVADRLERDLGATAPGPPRTPEALLAEVWAAARAPALRPYLDLFVELAAKAGREGGVYRDVAGRVADRFQTWLVARLVVEEGARADACAFRLLATLDGLVLLQAAGRGPPPEERGS